MAARNNKREVTATRMMSSGLASQREYWKKVENQGYDFSLIVAGAFVRGIRDIGYKSTGTALDELVDNSVQAEAGSVHVVLGFGEDSEKKPEKIAVIDDGHGMDPQMLRMAVMWGGTHRENDREGFGRYGYGMPSACVSQGKRFTCYSLVEGGDWNSVSIDIDDISEGKYSDKGGRVITPEPHRAELPEWVADYIKTHLKGFSHGTVVVVEKLDRLTYKTRDRLVRHLLEHFGVVYRNYLRNVTMYVQSEDDPASRHRVEPLDPLFTTPGCRYYDLDEDRAVPLEPMEISVRDNDNKGMLGSIKVRFSYMPPTFLRAVEDKKKERGKVNARFYVRKEHNGIVILRKGRQIDVVNSRCPWTTFVNYDRYWGIEVDFPPALDEEFSVTTSKQQVVLSDRIWEILREAGILKVIEQLRKRYKEELARLRSSIEKVEEDAKKPSEQAMEEAQKFKSRKPEDLSLEQKKRNQEKFDKEARDRAKKSGRPLEQVERELLHEVAGHPFVVREESLPGAPFFRVEQMGGQKILHLNTGHRFYSDVYAAPDSGPRIRAALEVLLFVIGDAELDSNGDTRTFYEMERGVWSRALSVTLERLSRYHDVDEDASAAAASEEPADSGVEREAEGKKGK